MPTIIMLGNIAIRMFAGDHNPPHFHIVTPDRQIAVLLSDFSLMAGSMDRQSLSIALIWAADTRRCSFMSGTVSTPADEIVSVGGPLPRLATVVPMEGRKLEVVFEDGRRKHVDLAPALESRRFYIPLRNDDALFRAFRISSYRDAIEWGEDLDFSAVWLDKLPSIEFDNADFRKAMEGLGMTLDGMAAALQISRRQVAAYRKNKPIPRHIGLATRYLVEHAA